MWAEAVVREAQVTRVKEGLTNRAEKSTEWKGHQVLLMGSEILSVQ